MCGIAGIIGKSALSMTRKMVVAMKHRGPDDSGVVDFSKATIGMSRLAILDCSSNGHQPMKFPDADVHIVYNGELYNFREQRQILEKKGHLFRTESDTEVVLHLYIRYGDSFLDRLRGMFALCIYDLREGPGKEKALLARDQFGVKPLVYSQNTDAFIFASELKPLVAANAVPLEVSPEALHQLLTYGSVLQPHTILKNVFALKPGHCIKINHTGIRIERYFNLVPRQMDRYAKMPYDQIVSQTRTLLEASIKRNLVSDVPLGSFLSGGIDSSLVTALIARNRSQKIKTFSVGFSDEPGAVDETTAAARTAQFLGTDHSKIVVTGRQVGDEIEKVALALDQPSVDGINAYYISQAAKQHVTVSISGTGGDELFAGYPWFTAMKQDYDAASASPLSSSIRRLFAHTASLARSCAWLPDRVLGLAEVLESHRDFPHRYFSQYHIYPRSIAAGMINPDAFTGHSPDSSLAQNFIDADSVRGFGPIRRTTAMCLQTYAQNQLLRDIDAVSMHHSLEIRVPFFDVELAQLALDMPDQAKLQPQEDPSTPSSRHSYKALGSKRILFDIGRDILPPNMDNQPKQGFAMPFTAWLRGPLKPILEDTLSTSSVLQRNIFRLKSVQKELARFNAGSQDWAKVWLLMMIELWFRQMAKLREQQ